MQFRVARGKGLVTAQALDPFQRLAPAHSREDHLLVALTSMCLRLCCFAPRMRMSSGFILPCQPGPFVRIIHEV
jgi:hypothetical protein